MSKRRRVVVLFFGDQDDEGGDSTRASTRGCAGPSRSGVKLGEIAVASLRSAVLPGAMFQLAYIGDMPIVGIPACGIYHETTIFDLVLPRLLAGERLDDRDLARLAVGGFCLNCKVCRYPACPMGKAC